VSLDQVAEKPVAELKGLPVVVGALADRDNPRVADRVAEPLKVVERRERVERL
jgi:hypothetical protein